MARRIQVSLITNQSTCGGNKKSGLVERVGTRNRSHVLRKTAPNLVMGCARGVPIACCKK